MYNFITNNDFIKCASEYTPTDGKKCGLKSFDDIMRIEKKTLTTLVATPCSGKSTFTNFYGYMMGITHNWKTLYLATETNKDDQAQKLSTLYGSYSEAAEHSIILEGPFNDWNELIKAIEDAKKAYNIDLCVIDNFTMLQHLIQGEVNTTSIGGAISTLKGAAEATDTAIILVAHTTKLNEGQRVTAYSVNGSANFNNISDYMFTLEISDYEAKETTINILKLRDDSKGKMNGKCTLHYDPITRKYTDNTPKDISNNIATDVMKAIMEEETQEDSQPATPAVKEVTKQEDSQPATQPAGTTKAAPAAKEDAKQEEKQAQRITPDFLLNTKVSIMERHNVLKISSLYNSIIMGKEHKKEIEAVRMIDRQANESEYRQAKAKVLSFTPSCYCTIGGTAKDVECINALIAVDLDAKDNEGVTIEEMRIKINSLPYVMYSSISVGGKGMYALLPIKEENKNDFKGVFNALNEDFKALGLTLDSSCVNVNRERYMSYDDNEYWNTKCEIYTKKISIPTQVNTTLLRGGDNANKPLTPREKQKVNEMIEDIKENRLQLTKNHTDTLMLANCIANVWGEEGRELFHLIRSQREGYDEYKTDKTFDDMLYNNGDNERYGLGFLFYKYNQAKQGQIQVN
ncbi:AAA family ATPase [Prevotella melaninogenica]|uniref:AAA family ATPase n=1 Tax=Prevotella melaninogenica TaxID=28132 RepID=UPI001BA6E205|nr:BT4734/BF3469 family protein [Prevotella melaninogenica]QUB66929.1 AAA family ATPase [Prevotella melaninogenica]